MTPPAFMEPPGVRTVGTLRVRLARNMLFTLIGRAWYVLVWFALTPYVLDRLGMERFGVWSVLFLLSGYLATLDLGLGTSVVKFTAERVARADWASLRATLAGINRLYVLLGLLWVALIVVFHPALLQWLKTPPQYSEEVRFALLASAAIFAFANLANTGPGVLNGLQRMDLSNGILVAASIPQIVVLVGGLRLGYGLYAVVASSATQWLATAALAWLALRRHAPEARWPSFARPERSTSWFGFSAVMQVNNLIGLTQQQLDKLLLTTLAGLRSVAEFELGFRVANGIQSLPLLLLGPLMPAFSELHAAGQGERYRRLCRRGSLYISGAAFRLWASFGPVAPLVVRAWIGPEHRTAETLAGWLLAGFALNMTTGVASAAARGAGRPALETGPGAAGVVVHVLASYFLVIRYGPVGVGPAFALAMATWSLLYLWRFAVWAGEPVRQLLATVFARPALAALPAAAAGVWLATVMPDAWLSSRGGLLAAALVAGAGAAAVFGMAWWATERVSRHPPSDAAGQTGEA